MPNASRLRLSFANQGELRVCLLLFLMAVLLYAFQYSTLEKFASVPPGTGLATLQEWGRYLQGRIGLSWHDALIPAAVTTLFLTVLSLEFRGPRTATTA